MNVTSSSFERFKKFVGSKKKEKSSVISKNPYFFFIFKKVKNKMDWQAFTTKYLKRKSSSVTSSSSARAIPEAPNFNEELPQHPQAAEMSENWT